MDNQSTKNLRRILLFVIPILFFVFIGCFYLLTGRYVSTEDAYMRADKAAINANVNGQAVEIYVKENQIVTKNTPLFKIDDKSYKINVAKAQAQLVNAELQVQGLKATYQQRLAELKQAQQNFLYEQEEYNRQKKLHMSGISSNMQLNTATNKLQITTQLLAASREQLANSLASLDNNPNIALENHPLVKEAQEQLKQANIALSDTLVKAPFSGVVTKVDTLQRGDYVSRGTPVFALVSTENIWVEANFKETEITHMHPGQHSEIHIDAYPRITLYGSVNSLSPGTGSTFSLLPAENATGNWVKIVQRVPVKITLKHQKSSFLFSSGLSVTVSVDTGENRIHRWIARMKNHA